jgi:hypothetical protein
MKTLLLIPLLFLALQYGGDKSNTIPASGGTISGCSGAPSDTGSSGCVMRETFEGSTLCYTAFGSYCDNAWTYANGSANFDYTTSPAPLQKTRSIYFPSGSANYAYINFTPSTTVYAGSMVNFSALPGNDNIIFKLETQAASATCYVEFYGTTQFLVFNSGGTTQLTTVSVSAATTYYIKLKAVAGSGTNSSCTPYYSANGTSWTTGTASTDGTWTTDAGRLLLGGLVSATNLIGDDYRISTSDFNYW